MLPVNSQQPVDSDQEADVLSGQPHRREDQEHGHESSTGDTGRSNAGQSGCHAKKGKQIPLSAGGQRALRLNPVNMQATYSNKGGMTTIEMTHQTHREVHG